MAIHSLSLKKGFDKRVKSGHPWIFSNELQQIPKLSPGTIVDVLDANGIFVGRGSYNSQSLISIRLFTRSQEELINEAFFRTKIENAYRYRQQLNLTSDSYRLVYADSDSLPGLIIDKYHDHFILQVLTAGMELWKPIVASILIDKFQPKCIYERSDSAIRQLEGLVPVRQVLYGEPEINLITELDGLKFIINIIEGQKTGFFLDHRNNRNSLCEWVPKKQVLDLFCGTGVWSLYAAKFGAKSVLGIDSSSTALEIANRNTKLNHFEDICSYRLGDAFDETDALIKENKKYDVIICDPPAFAKSKQHIPTALKGYKKINKLAFQLLKPGGILVSSSCSYHINRVAFEELVTDSLIDMRLQARLIRFGTQSLDHPILLTVPETDYLKCMTIQLI